MKRLLLSLVVGALAVTLVAADPAGGRAYSFRIDRLDGRVSFSEGTGHWKNMQLGPPAGVVAEYRLNDRGGHMSPRESANDETPQAGPADVGIFMKEKKSDDKEKGDKSVVTFKVRCLVAQCSVSSGDDIGTAIEVADGATVHVTVK